MTILLFILAGLLLASLVVATAITPRRSQYSDFEISRRKSAGEPHAKQEERRELLYGDLISIQRVIQAVALVGLVACMIGLLGWFGGIVVALVVSLLYGRLAASQWTHRWSQRLYDQYENDILSFVERNERYVGWVRTLAPGASALRLASREELRNLITESTGVLSRNESSFILAGLDFDNKRVSDIMTPKSVVETVKRTEMLGPLVLDGLHKTGHNRFPVIEDDIDHVVGILYLRDVATLDGSKKHTAKVESAMSKQVYYIRQDHSLSQALTAFLKTHHHLFIVINEYRETVGIITLEDTIETLLGKRIIDEFDAHDDMRAVAERNAASTDAPNRTIGSVDV